MNALKVFLKGENYETGEPLYFSPLLQQSEDAPDGYTLNTQYKTKGNFHSFSTKEEADEYMKDFPDRVIMEVEVEGTLSKTMTLIREVKF